LARTFFHDDEQPDPITQIRVFDWLEDQNLGILLGVIEKATAAIRKREHARADAVREAVEAELGPTTTLPPVGDPGVQSTRRR